MLAKFAVMFSALAASCSNHIQTPASTSAITDSEIEKIVDSLVNLGKETAGSESTAWGSQFMAIDEEPRFMGGIIGSQKPTVDPAMKKLVQLGVRALPILIKHLDDKRETKLATKHDMGFGAMWHSDEYDPRYSDKARQPKNINSYPMLSHSMDHTIDKFTLHVGDACYIVIGQIVDRGLSVIRYQPTACIVVNSPIQCPALADAVKKDWGGLTKLDHASQLEADAYSMWPGAAGSAVKHLLFYYPEKGEKLALKLLNRKVYDYMAIWNIADDEMLKTGETAKWRQIYAKTQERYGQDAAAMIPHWTHWSNWETSRDHPKADQERASAIFKALFPKYDPTANVFHPVVEARDQADLIRDLETFRSKALDDAIQNTFRNAILTKGRPDLTIEKERRRVDGLDSIAGAAYERMKGKGYDKEYLAYFEQRIAEVEKFSKEAWEIQYLDEDRKRVADLKRSKS